jgi:hypothetical protein
MIETCEQMIQLSQMRPHSEAQSEATSSFLFSQGDDFPEVVA